MITYLDQFFGCSFARFANFGPKTVLESRNRALQGPVRGERSSLVAGSGLPRHDPRTAADASHLDRHRSLPRRIHCILKQTCESWSQGNIILVDP